MTDFVLNLTRLVLAAQEAAVALADAEHICENEWGRVGRRAEWEARTDQHGPSDELRELRAALAPFIEKVT